MNLTRVDDFLERRNLICDDGLRLGHGVLLLLRPVSINIGHRFQDPTGLLQALVCVFKLLRVDFDLGDGCLELAEKSGNAFRVDLSLVRGVRLEMVEDMELTDMLPLQDLLPMAIAARVDVLMNGVTKSLMVVVEDSRV